MMLRQKPGQGGMAGRPWQAGQDLILFTAARQLWDGSTWEDELKGNSRVHLDKHN